MSRRLDEVKGGVLSGYQLVNVFKTRADVGSIY
jgi:hypothetical protein